MAVDKDLDLEISRLIKAPRALVWKAWSDPAHLKEWWCPRPWRMRVIDVEWRAGGRSAMEMLGPDGEVMPNDGIVLEFVPGKRWVSTDAFTAGCVPAGPFMVGIWEIEPEGDGTRYTARARHWSAEACAQHSEMGFEAGWGAAADQLAALVEG
mgnify:CR=1 FL=1